MLTLYKLFFVLTFVLKNPSTFSSNTFIIFILKFNITPSGIYLGVETEAEIYLPDSKCQDLQGWETLPYPVA